MLLTLFKRHPVMKPRKLFRRIPDLRSYHISVEFNASMTILAGKYLPTSTFFVDYPLLRRAQLSAKGQFWKKMSKNRASVEPA